MTSGRRSTRISTLAVSPGRSLFTFSELSTILTAASYSLKSRANPPVELGTDETMSTTPLHLQPLVRNIPLRFFKAAHGKAEEAPSSSDLEAEEDVLELTTPTKTAEDIPWDSRLSYIPHKHRWPT